VLQHLHDGKIDEVGVVLPRLIVGLDGRKVATRSDGLSEFERSA
jgi:hypothetical protein